MRVELGDIDQQARIKVIGVGGGGGNAVANMIEEQMDGVEFISINTDAQALSANPAPYKIQIGANLTKGLGAGGIPEQGRKAALEDVQRLEEALSGADMVFVAAGMGGGTGTGAAAIVAQVARDAGALTVGVVTKPFRFEGRKRCRLADDGITGLREEVDTLITIPNERLLTLEQNLTMRDAFRFADKVLSNAVRGISDLITIRGDVNVDFADVRTIMTNRGRALMGTGYGKGNQRALDAAKMAISSPLLEDVAIDGAMGILINITGGPDLTMQEVAEAISMVQDSAHEDALIIFGNVTLEEPCEEVKITVIATGFGIEEPQRDLFRHGAAGHVQISSSPRSSGIYASSRDSMPSRAHVAPAVTTRLSASMPEQVQMNARGPIVRHTASETDLDIPTFLRKHSE